VSLASWLAKRYDCPDKLINLDLKQSIHCNNFNTTTWDGIVQVDRCKNGFSIESDLNNILFQFIQFKNSGHVLRAKNKLLGLF
jgi:hypothetical protein